MPSGRWQQSGLILQTGLQRRTQSGGLLNQTSLAGDLTRNKVHLIPQEQAVKEKRLVSSEACLLDTFIKHPFCIFAPVIPVNLILKKLLYVTHFIPCPCQGRKWSLPKTMWYAQCHNGSRPELLLSFLIPLPGCLHEPIGC